uniref:Truncated nef protein n=1 Tax=Human immunodeficiency virus type 1 TaxID=11676 RepID=H9TQ68_HV1|nr:truncated nef protein [Human immunodeficiency virus 1]
MGGKWSKRSMGNGWTAVRERETSCTR